MRRSRSIPKLPVGNQVSESQKIRWRDWSPGLNSEDDPRDLPLGSCLVLSNFDIKSKGKLKVRPGYTSYLSNVPSGLAIKRVFQYKVTKPSVQTIDIVIGVKSSLVKVYAVNTTLFARPTDSNGWRDLTEYHQFACEAGTTGTGVVGDLGGVHTTADDLKGWYIINLTDGFSGIVTASSYSGGSGFHTLTINDDIDTAAANEILLSRYPLIGHYASGNVTSYDLSVTDYDDVSFSIDDEALRVNFGSNDDTECGIWFGYIDRYLIDGNQNSDTTTANGYNHGGWWCESQEMQRPGDEGFSGSNLQAYDETTDPLPADDYTLRCSYIYDGNQEGPLVDYDASHLDVTVGNNQAIQYYPGIILYNHYFTSGEGLYIEGSEVRGTPMFLSHRITGFNVYLSTDKVNYYLVDSLTVSSDSSQEVIAPLAYQYIKGVNWDARGGTFADRSGYGSFPYIEEDRPTHSAVFCGTQTMVRGRRIIGDMRQPDPEDFTQYVFRLAGAQPHANGTWNNDVFGLGISQQIEIKTAQIDRVMGLEELNGGLVVLKENSLHYIDFGGGRMDTWTVRVSNENLGAVSRRSITRVPGGIIFAGKDNIYFFDGVNTVPITKPWESGYQALSDDDKEGAIGNYYAKENQYVVFFPSTETMYVFDISLGAWTSDTTITGAVTLADIAELIDGTLLGVAASQCYVVWDSSASTNTSGLVITSIHELGPQYDWKIEKVFLTHEGGNSDVTIKLFTDSQNTTLETIVFAAPTSANGKQVSKKRVSHICNDIAVQVLSESNSNYDAVVNEVMLLARPIRERRGAIA